MTLPYYKLQQEVASWTNAGKKGKGRNSASAEIEIHQIRQCFSSLQLSSSDRQILTMKIFKDKICPEKER